MNKLTSTLLLAFCLYGNLNSDSYGEYRQPRTHIPDSLANDNTKRNKIQHSSRKRRLRRTMAAAITKAALLDSIADLESKTSGDWKANNHNLYIGRYQIGPEVLAGQGYKPSRVKHIFSRFAKRPEIFPAPEQEKTVKVWMGIVEEEMYDDIQTYTNKRRNGIRITKAGILAASHRVGTVGVKCWLRWGHCRYTQRVNRTMRRYAQTTMRETFKTRRTSSLYQESLRD